MSEEGEDIRQDFREDRRAGDRKAISRVFDWATGIEQLDIVEGSAPSETKEETSKAQPSEKNKDDGGTPGPIRNLSGNRSGRATLTREEREQLGSNHRENRATGRRHKHSPRKGRNGGKPVGYSERMNLRKEQCGM
jgi:hypothetical protein